MLEKKGDFGEKAISGLSETNLTCMFYFRAS